MTRFTNAARACLAGHIKSPAFWLMLAIAAVYTVASLTGRYDAPVGMDEVRDVANAYELVHHGVMPRFGTVSGLHALTTPGVSFAYVPGIILSPGNPAAAERIGAACMFLGTLFGLWLWLDKRFGAWASALSMALFAAGSAGCFFAVSLWPRAHPFFYVWMLLFLTLWVERRDAKFLAAALVAYAAGLYWFMEFAPAILAMPVIYFLYRPPLGWRWVTGALAASLLIWSPFLAFEASRDYADIKSILTQTPRTDLPPSAAALYDAKNHLVDATYAKNVIENNGKGEATADTKVEDCDRWFATPEWGTVWFQAKERQYLGEPGYFFYSDKLGGWTFQSVTSGRIVLQGRKDWEAEPHAVAFPTTRQPAALSGVWLKKTETKAMAFAPLKNLAPNGCFSLYAWHLALFAAALAYAFRKSAFASQTRNACRAWLGRPAKANGAPDDRQSAAWCVMLVGATVPAIALCIAMRNDTLFDGERRFWWMWIASAALIGCAAGSLVVKGRRLAVPLGILAVATLSMNERTEELVRGAFGRGLGYKGNAEAALDALAEVVKKDGKTEAFIGYDMNLFSWQIDARLVDGTTKSFAELDEALLMRHGIRNLDTTAEGISPRDEYILRSTNYGYVSAKNSIAARRWSMTIDGSLPQTEVAARSGEYEIRRVKNAR
jgi:hypothetical protein